jgi:hypothetical protein
MRAISQSAISRWIFLLLSNNSIQEKTDLTYFKYEDKQVSSPSPSMKSYNRSRAELQGRKMEAIGLNQSLFLERRKYLVPTGIQNPDNPANSLVVVLTML